MSDEAGKLVSAVVSFLMTYVMLFLFPSLSGFRRIFEPKLRREDQTLRSQHGRETSFNRVANLLQQAALADLGMCSKIESPFEGDKIPLGRSVKG